MRIPLDTTCRTHLRRTHAFHRTKASSWAPAPDSTGTPGGLAAAPNSPELSTTMTTATQRPAHKCCGVTTALCWVTPSRLKANLKATSMPGVALS